MAISGGILAGGAGRRVGGRDKGWLMLAHRPLVMHVLTRLAPQVDELLISANRHLPDYRALPVARVLEDEVPDHPGPLHGILRLLQAASHPMLLIVPCDGPQLPLDLGRRLRQALRDTNADIAVAHDGKRLQPLFALLRSTEVASLRDAYAQGQRSMRDYLAQRNTVSVDFSDQPGAFVNLNTPTDFTQSLDAKT